MSGERGYKLTIRELAGIAVFDAAGSFTHADVWELVGEKSRVATFTFAGGSPTATKLGASVVGVPLYAPKERASQGSNCGPNLRIDAAMHDVSKDVKRELEYPGVPLTDIDGIAFVPFDRAIERHETGEKKIPNIIEIPYKHDPTVNIDRITQSFLITKNNHGTELTRYEKDQLIGITLGLNDGRIDVRILNHFGFTVESAEQSEEVRFYRLETKERQGKALANEEATALEYLRAKRRMTAIAKVVEELKTCKFEGSSDAQLRDALQTVLDAVVKFRPSVVVDGKRQIYWDLDSYVHIAMGHIREMQVGSLARKTPFPYKPGDLETLIGKVLAIVKDDIHTHFGEQPAKVFFRAGTRSVYFHGDYYSFHIEPDGRLANFHPFAPDGIPRADARSES